jgi:branched-chain amino acid transport system permease protein
MQYVVDGLLIGCVYGLAAMGMTLIWGVMDVINMAHGVLIALGSFGMYLLFTSLGINPYLGVVLAGAGGLLLGVGIYRVAIRRVLDASHLSTLLATFAINMILVGLGTAAFSTNPRAVDVNLGSLTIGSVTVQTTRLVAALASILIAGALYLFLNQTTPGKFIRAITNNRDSAELMGIDSQRMLALSFGLGCMLATLALDPLRGHLSSEELHHRGPGRVGEPVGRIGRWLDSWAIGGNRSSLSPHLLGARH